MIIIVMPCVTMNLCYRLGRVGSKVDRWVNSCTVCLQVGISNDELYWNTQLLAIFVLVNVLFSWQHICVHL